MIELLLGLAGSPATMDELARDPEVLAATREYKVCVRAHAAEHGRPDLSPQEIGRAADEACTPELEAVGRVVSQRAPVGWRGPEVVDNWVRTLRLLETANTEASVRKAREAGDAK